MSEIKTPAEAALIEAALVQARRSGSICLDVKLADAVLAERAQTERFAIIQHAAGGCWLVIDSERMSETMMGRRGAIAAVMTGAAAERIVHALRLVERVQPPVWRSCRGTRWGFGR